MSSSVQHQAENALQVPEAQWEAYYRERACLDFRTAEALWKEDDPSPLSASKPAWGESFELPQMQELIQENYASCPADALRELCKAISKGLSKVIKNSTHLPGNKATLQERLQDSTHIITYR